MHISWFPGHMTKSLREIEASLPLADVVLYVLDARAPKSCINPSFNELIKNKPVIYILNKADLAPMGGVNAWKGKLSDSKSFAVAVTGTASGAVKIILPLVQKLAAPKIEKYRQKGLNASLRGMVIGVPNSGKSTIINNFCNKGKTVTGNKPGVTRGQQWVRVNDYFELLDTPGTLYPKLSDQQTARKLAYIGCIKDEVTDTFELCRAFLEELKALAPLAITERYGIKEESGAVETLEKIARARGLIGRGGEADPERAAVAVLDDFRKGKLGKILLDPV